MRMRRSIKFTQHGIARVRAEVKARRWSIGLWAKKADVSVPTLKSFLNGEDTDHEMFISTVDKILRPLGMVAADVMRTYPTTVVTPPARAPSEADMENLSPA